MRHFLLLILFMSFGGQAQELDSFKKIQLKTIPGSELSKNFDLGFFWKYVPHEMYGVYGLGKDGGKDKLLGKVVISSLSLGLTGSMFIFSDDNTIDIEDVEGLELKDICSRFWGGEIGGTFIAGGTGFTSINKNGVVMKSSVSTAGLIQILAAGVTIKIKCLEKESNPNWNKFVWFE